MFDYAQRLKLALADQARRSVFKLAAGLILAIGLGFLLAALWSWLATVLGWGSAHASLAIGLGLVVIAGGLLLATSRPRHPMPSTEDLKREVEARAGLAADAAVQRARSEALRMAGLAENKVHSMMNRATHRASTFAGDAARKAGLSSDNLETARRAAGQASQKASQAANSNAGSMAKLIAAFAIGVTLATRLRESRRQQPDDFDEDDLT